MAEQAQLMGLIQDKLARCEAQLLNIGGDLRRIRGLLEEQAERSSFAEIVVRLKERGLIPQAFDASRLDEAVSRGDAESAEVTVSDCCGVSSAEVRHA